MPANSLDATAPYAAPADVPTRTAPAGTRPGVGFEEELRRLLRSRLLFVYLLNMAILALIVVTTASIPRRTSDPPFSLAEVVPLLVGFVQTLVGALVLWRRPAMSLRSLRIWELLLFGTAAAVGGVSRFEE